MGTLFDQDPRNFRSVANGALDDFLAKAVTLSKKHGVSVAEVVAAANVLQLERKNDLAVDNGDAFDEQVGGIGELLEKIAGAIEDLSEGGT